MKMTFHEIVLLGTIIGVLLLGSVVKHFRDAQRLAQPVPISSVTPKAKPLYVSDKRR
jgi:hypothetical protein